ncbi:hypothetical protein B6N60_02575 [Richelia sinica FACHB-800]|uniref:Uncharacterized protein n=1 Tax=Richelia sinica FACHB-800 TaxID=1357546 RepID=A0A975Y558_9NOST|nr:hypothetical protein B6N60_02575 [Richelia sinica FACHB-800]
MITIVRIQEINSFQYESREVIIWWGKSEIFSDYLEKNGSGNFIATIFSYKLVCYQL